MRIDRLDNNFEVRILETCDIHRFLPKRDVYSHKGDFGKVMLLCGSVGYTGAAAMAARAALRCGSGLVYVLVPEMVYPIIAAKLDEAMVFPVPCDEDGKVSKEAKALVSSRISSSTASLLGPGLGRSEEITRLLHEVVLETQKPLILDADGLNAFAGHIDLLEKANCPIILTPHDGEFSRLLPCESTLPRDNLPMRCEAAMKLARMSGTVVLLKGHRTIITDGEKVYINHTGNPGMATGGSGDVLAGMILSFLGQGLMPMEAAALGAFIHGAAGDLCAEEIGEYGLLPGDMILTAARLLK